MVLLRPWLADTPGESGFAGGTASTLRGDPPAVRASLLSAALAPSQPTLDHGDDIVDLFRRQGLTLRVYDGISPISATNFTGA